MISLGYYLGAPMVNFFFFLLRTKHILIKSLPISSFRKYPFQIDSVIEEFIRAIENDAKDANTGILKENLIILDPDYMQDYPPKVCHTSVYLCVVFIST
jgi:hypothetical protein